MSLNLKLDIPFENELLFHGFLPESDHETLHVMLRDGAYSVKVWLADRNNQLAPEFVRLTEQEIAQHAMLGVTGLTIEIEATSPNPAIIEALERDKPSSEINIFAKELFDIVLEIYNSLSDYFRNHGQQYWVGPFEGNPENYLYFLKRWHLSQKDHRGEWKAFPITNELTVHLSLAPMFRMGIDRQEWTKVASHIERGRPSPMKDVLIVNSLQHLSQKNGRLAIVEAVIALETSIKRCLPDAIQAMLRFSQVTLLDDRNLDKVFEAMGLRLAVDTILRWISIPLGLQDDQITLVLEAIEERNRIVHTSQREVEVSKAQEYVLAILGVIEAVDQWDVRAGYR